MSKKTYFTLILLLLFSGMVTAYFLLLKTPQAEADNYWNRENVANPAHIDHTLWQEILDEYLIVDQQSRLNYFDYEGLKNDGAEILLDYLSTMTTLDPRDYNRSEQFAYWINLYNALTVKLIIEHYPVASITELGDNSLSFGPWDDPVTHINNKAITLNHIEHRILRPLWKDHRIHFAVNCASIGCPNLQDQAFTGDNKEALLNKAAKDYLAHPRGLQFKEDKLILSSIFDWYKDDFGSNTSAQLATLSRYLPTELAAKVSNYNGSIDYRYDWQLNAE